MVSEGRTFIILLHHSRNQTTLPSCEHLSSIHCHCVSLFTLQDDGNNRKSETNSAKWSKTTLKLVMFMFYHNLFQALLNCGGFLAFNGGDVTLHTLDAPCVTLVFLSEAHGTPLNGTGCSGWGLFWKAK